MKILKDACLCLVRRKNKNPNRKEKRKKGKRREEIEKTNRIEMLLPLDSSDRIANASIRSQAIVVSVELHNPSKTREKERKKR